MMALVPSSPALGSRSTRLPMVWAWCADATPFANHLNLAGMSAGNFVAGRFGNAASFNGSSSYLTYFHEPDDYPARGLPIFRAGRSPKETIAATAGQLTWHPSGPIPRIRTR